MGIRPSTLSLYIKLFLLNRSLIDAFQSLLVLRRASLTCIRRKGAIVACLFYTPRQHRVDTWSKYRRRVAAPRPSLLLALGSALLPVNLPALLWSGSDRRSQLAARCQGCGRANGDSDIHPERQSFYAELRTKTPARACKSSALRWQTTERRHEPHVPQCFSFRLEPLTVDWRVKKVKSILRPLIEGISEWKTAREVASVTTGWDIFHSRCVYHWPKYHWQPRRLRATLSSPWVLASESPRSL